MGRTRKIVQKSATNQKTITNRMETTNKFSLLDTDTADGLLPETAASREMDLSGLARENSKSQNVAMDSNLELGNSAGVSIQQVGNVPRHCDILPNMVDKVLRNSVHKPRPANQDATHCQGKGQMGSLQSGNNVDRLEVLETQRLKGENALHCTDFVQQAVDVVSRNSQSAEAGVAVRRFANSNQAVTVDSPEH